MIQMRIIGTAIASIAIVTASPLVAGPLDPPAGAIAPTPGPEPRIAVNALNTPGDADELYKITEPGSYYLERNSPTTLSVTGT